MRKKALVRKEETASEDPNFVTCHKQLVTNYPNGHACNSAKYTGKMRESLSFLFLCLPSQLLEASSPSLDC